jgi:hypothetical protein
MDEISAYDQLARALFGAYLHSSGGLSWDGKPVPTWSEVLAKAGAVPSHWRHVASAVAPRSASTARNIAVTIELAHKDSAVYQRVTQ